MNNFPLRYSLRNFTKVSKTFHFSTNSSYLCRRRSFRSSGHSARPTHRVLRRLPRDRRGIPGVCRQHDRPGEGGRAKEPDQHERRSRLGHPARILRHRQVQSQPRTQSEFNKAVAFTWMTRGPTEHFFAILELQNPPIDTF